MIAIAICLDTKEPKSQVSKKASLPHGPLRTSGQNSRAYHLLPHDPARPPASATLGMPLPLRTAHHVLPTLAEAALLTGIWVRLDSRILLGYSSRGEAFARSVLRVPQHDTSRSFVWSPRVSSP